jgi:type I site-specific restriction-modification system R (restriction) subunit
VLFRDLRAALERLNPGLPPPALEQALERITRIDYARSPLQHNREYYGFIRGGVPVEWRDASGETRHAHARVIDFRDASRNRFLAVRELKIQGVRAPHCNRRADLVCFVNGLPLVFIELKAVYRNIRAGFDNNLTDYLSEHCIAHAFHHNAFLVVSNGDRALYGSITGKWEHFVAWKRDDEKDKARLDAVARRRSISVREAGLSFIADPDLRERLNAELRHLKGRAEWMESAIIEIVISEAQNEVRDYKKYQEIIADYNREKDRATVEATFAELVALAESLDAEQRRAAVEGLSEDELALFDLLFKDKLGKANRERLKQASKALLASLTELLSRMQSWTQKAATQAEVRVFILDKLYESLPRPPFSDGETDEIASRVYDYVWQRSAGGEGLRAA